MTKKQWKEHAKNLEDELDVAYSTIRRLEIDKVADKFEIETVTKHIDVAETELYRKEVIIEYLEERLNERD